MREFNWKDCLEENSAIKVNVDNGKSKSLIETAEGRINFLNKQETNEENVNYVFEGFYTSLLELIHALATKKG